MLSWHAGTLEWSRFSVIVIFNTCAFPSMTGQDLCCEKELINPDRLLILSSNFGEVLLLCMPAHSTVALIPPVLSLQNICCEIKVLGVEHGFLYGSLHMVVNLLACLLFFGFWIYVMIARRKSVFASSGLQAVMVSYRWSYISCISLTVLYSLFCYSMNFYLIKLYKWGKKTTPYVGCTI